jgi:hypothetical protein
MKILFQGDPESQLAHISKKLGEVTFFDSSQPVDGFDLVALDGNQWAKDVGATGDFFRQALNAGKILCIYQLQESQVEILYEITGVKPAHSVFGVVAEKIINPGNISHYHYRCNFIPLFSEDWRNLVKSKGHSPETLINTFIYQGLKNQLTTSGNSFPTNDLIPTYQISPFGKVDFSLPVSVNIGNMKNLSTMSLEMDTSLYCYHANADGYNDYWVIALNSLKNVNPGGPVIYIDQNTPCCATSPVYYTWTQVFTYLISLTPLDGQGNAFANGVTSGNISPAVQNAATSFNVEVGQSPNPISIYMHVLNGGSWMDVVFNPYYLHKVDNDNVKYFDIVKNDDPKTNQAGLGFAVPQDYLRGLFTPAIPYPYVSSTATVDLEFITVFKFDGTLATNGKLEVIFRRDFNFQVKQDEFSETTVGGVYSPSNTVTDGSQSAGSNSTIVDLVNITNKG